MGERIIEMSARAEALAIRIERGGCELAAAVEDCSTVGWEAFCPDEKWSVGTTVHHVASMYPIEIELVQVLASGQPVVGITWRMLDEINATHAIEHGHPTRAETLALLRENCAWAANQVRALTDEQLDRAAAISLHADAPLTTQYFIEQHPISHPYIHLVSIRAVLAAGAS
jgi:hypothetical protein